MSYTWCFVNLEKLFCSYPASISRMSANKMLGLVLQLESCHIVCHYCLVVSTFSGPKVAVGFFYCCCFLVVENRNVLLVAIKLGSSSRPHAYCCATSCNVTACSPSSACLVNLPSSGHHRHMTYLRNKNFSTAALAVHNRTHSVWCESLFVLCFRDN